MPFDTIFPNNPPPMPPEMMDAIGDTGPGPLVDSMGGGMEAFAGAMQGGGDIAAGGEAFMDFMHDACANGDVPGVTPEMFDGMADAFSDVAGPAMMGMPADASPADMGEVFMDAATMMMPEGFDMPPEMADMFGGMADTFADTGCSPHDIGAEFGPPMPDGAVPGDPASFPEGDFAPPPGDMAGGPEGGMAPPPGDMAGGPEGGMAPPPGDMAGGAADALGGALGAGPVDGPGDVGAGAAALGGAAAAGDMAANAADPAAAVDAAVGSAMDAAMEQGGAPVDSSGITEADSGYADAAGAQEDEVDPSAGMG